MLEKDEEDYQGCVDNDTEVVFELEDEQELNFDED